MIRLLSRLFVFLAVSVLATSSQALVAQTPGSLTQAQRSLSARKAAGSVRPAAAKDKNTTNRTITIKRKGVTTRYTQTIKKLRRTSKIPVKTSSLPPKSHAPGAKTVILPYKAAAGLVHPQYGGPSTTVVNSQDFGSATVGGQSVAQTLTYPGPAADTTLSFTLAGGVNFTVQAAPCMAASCTATVTFTPLNPGRLNDALSITDSNGNLIDQTFLSGIGTGPQFQFLFGEVQPLDVPSSRPTGAAFGPDGSFYVVDAVNKTVLTGTSDGLTNIPIAGLCDPSGIAVDGSGTIYIADPVFNRVIAYSSLGVESVVQTTPLLNPAWVAVDGTGALYISDYGNNRIIKLDSHNVETTVQSGLNAPTGIAVDAVGDLFFADANNNGEISELLASTGQVISIATGLGTVEAVATDASGRVFYDTQATLGVLDPATGDSVTMNVDEESDDFLFGLAIAPDGRLLTTTHEGIFMTLAAGGELTFNPEFVPINTTVSGTQTIANSGNTPLTFSSIAAQAPFTVDSATQCNPESALASGASCDVIVDFTPTQAIDYTGNLTATSNSLNAPGTPATALLEGVGEGASTQTILTVSPVNGPLEATITLTAAISQLSGQELPAPTGTVTFSASNSTSNITIGTVTLSGGTTTATITTNQLPAGSYAFIASYSGDSYNSLSDAEVSGTVGIGTTSSSATLSPSAYTLALSQPVTITYTIIGQGSATPTGTISFTDDDAPLGTAQLTGTGNVATATLSLSGLQGGQNAIYASFPGDPTYAPAVTNETLIQVAPGPSSTALTIIPSPATTSQIITLTATVTSGTNPPVDGEVIFSDQNGVLGTAYYVSPTSTGGTATLTPYLSIGTHQITAQYTDDNSYTDSTSTVQTVVVTPGGPALNLTASAANINVGQTELLTLQIGSSNQFADQGSSAAPGETGTVTFSDQNGVLGTATVCNCPSGIYATLALTTLTPGVHQITATYNGDANYAVATSNTQTVTVGGTVTLAPTATTLSVSPATSVIGQPVVLTASVTSLSAPPGTVTFSDQNGPLGNATLGTGDSTSQATLTISTLSVGTHLIEATYPGNANFAASASQPQTVVVAALAAQVITFPAIPNHVVGDVPFLLAATSTSGLPIMYTVLSGPATVTGNLVTLTGAAGTVIIQAAQAGDAIYAAATPVTQSFTVSLPAVLSLASISPNSGAIGSPATTITLTGTDFSTSDVVLLNGTVIPSTYVSATTLTATLPASFFVSAGSGILTVKDTSTQTSTAGVTFIVSTSPQIVFTGPTSAVSGQQPALTFQLVNPYPVDLAGSLSLTFTPSTPSGINDPNVQFASGGRALAFTIPANSIVTPPIQLQTGTVAGTATISLAVAANGVVVTPANLAPVIIVIPPAVPTITSTKLTRNGDTLTVSVVGFSNTREAVQASFHFNAVPGGSIDNPDVTLTVGTNFAGWYVTPASDSYGSAFTYTQDFTLDQGSALIQDVTVTLTNAIGSSSPALTP